ncbi:MAG: phage major tail protein, TP901-1 family, partial [Enterococcus faecalis]|nr:phage major tail protein, TP901-1 family [Enterococcus faecalis]
MANEAKVAAKGIDIILLFRLLKKSKEEAAWKLAFQTEQENTKTKDSDSVTTKDGPIRIPGSLEIDFSATSILSVGDPYVDQLEEALDNDDIIEIWEINKAEKGTGDNA